MRRTSATIVASLLILCGCVGDGDRPPPQHARRPPPPPTVNSPNGEPLPAEGPEMHCDQLLAQWFERADRDRDGWIDLAEFKADAARWFQLADLDHDGVVTPSELATLRARFAPGLREPPPDGAPTRAPAGGNAPPGFTAGPVLNAGPGGGAGGGPGGPPGKRPDSFVPPGPARNDTRTDPVMAADTNLDFRVTPEEFQALAERRFAALDQAHAGRIDKARVVATCGQKSAP